MKKRILSLIFLVGSGFTTSAQSTNLIWAQGSGSVDFEMVRDISTDNNGNVISVGQFTNTVDFDPSVGTLNLISQGSSDIFIMKQDSDGNLIWAHSFGAYDSDAAYGVGIDALNNIYITGTFRYEVDFDPTAGNYIIGNTLAGNAGQIFLLKLDADGELVWVNYMGNTSGSSQGLVISVEPNGNSVISGTFNTTVDFDPFAGTTNLTANTTTNYDIFIATYTVDGDFGWAYSFGGDSGNNFPEDITHDITNNIILSGSFGGTADLDPTAGVQTTATVGFDDAFIMKFTSGGMFLWAKTIGSIWGDYGFAVVADSNEDIYFAGSFRQDVDLDTGPGTALYSIGSNENTFVIKLSWNGTFIWAKTLESGYSRPHGADIDENDNIYIAGGFSGTVDFDPGAGVVNKTSIDNFDDTYAVILDSDGIYQNSLSVGAVNDDRAEAISVVSSDEFYFGGFFNNTIDFNPTVDNYFIGSNGSGDNFVAKFGTCAIDNSVTTSGTTLTANQSGAIYQWMDCSIFSNVPGATSQSFSPSADGDYAVIITQGGCKDTSICYAIVGVGMEDLNQTNFTIYPNPTNSNLTISTSEKIIAINVYSISGVLVRKENKATFSVENLPAGMYFLEIETENGIGTAKFVKE